MAFFSGNSNRRLALEIGRYLKIPLGNADVTRFADGEVHVMIKENVRGKDCFVLQGIAPPVNENLMELLVMLDALRRASAGKITAVIPYFGYARADRKAQPRTPITAKLVANILASSGASRVITVDLHAGQIQGFFDIPLDHLFVTKVLLSHLIKRHIKDVVVVSPDVGGVERARYFAKVLKCQLAFVDKRRPRANEANVYNVVGQVKGKQAVIVDDIIDTGGTLTKVAKALMKRGASSCSALISHGLLTRNALNNIEQSALSELVLTNSIDLSEKISKSKKIRTVSIAGLLGEAIRRNHCGESISELYKDLY
ncbi:ribose-phosphate pyrophosphokinase [Elusimicrobiota bacterium]